ncbi:MAG: sulfite exporter TauE/SafE family protein, partial [Bacteroidetes bacterium]
MEMDFSSFDLSLAELIIFVVAGVLTGVINTLAGSGSLITLPIFIFICGLPAPLANGTNRIGVAFQTLVALREFKKSGVTTFAGSTTLLAPSVIGGIIGSMLAVEISEQAMNYTIGGLMVFMLVVLLLRPERWIRETTVDLSRNRHPLTILTFFLIGIYGGFIQAGVGIFLLAALVWISNYSLRAANGIKILVVFMFTLPTLLVFWHNDQIHF